MTVDLERIVIKKMNFSNPLYFGSAQQLTADISHNYEIKDDHSQCRIVLDCTVKEVEPVENDNGLSIAVSVIGEYSIKTDDTNINIDDELKALMIRQVFPYVRNTISMITAIAGIPIVTVPILDINSVLKK